MSHHHYRGYLPPRPPGKGLVPTHGTVEQEMLANGHFRCVCGKMHLRYVGRTCPCGEPFPEEFREFVCRSYKNLLDNERPVGAY